MSLTKQQRVNRLVAQRTPLERRHERLTVSDRGSTRHDSWGVCHCGTAKRLRHIAVALANLTTPRPAAGDTNDTRGRKAGEE